MAHCLDQANPGILASKVCEIGMCHHIWNPFILELFIVVGITCNYNEIKQHFTSCTAVWTILIGILQSLQKVVFDGAVVWYNFVGFSLLDFGISLLSVSMSSRISCVLLGF